MLHEFSRTELLIGSENIKKLTEARVIVFGVGGVGSYTAEALARSGIGAIDIVDDDDVALTNINRQLIALHSTVGRLKADVVGERILDINPNCTVTLHKTFVTAENASEYDFSKYDYVVDAIDTVTAKLKIIELASKVGTPIISIMGTGNKLDASRFEVADIYETSVCPLARIMRKELKKRGVESLKVVYSREMPLTPVSHEEPAAPETEQRVGSTRRQTPGSLPFVPPVAGMIAAGEVVLDICGIERSRQ